MKIIMKPIYIILGMIFFISSGWANVNQVVPRDEGSIIQLTDDTVMVDPASPRRSIGDYPGRFRAADPNRDFDNDAIITPVLVQVGAQ